MDATSEHIPEGNPHLSASATFAHETLAHETMPERQDAVPALCDDVRAYRIDLALRILAFKDHLQRVCAEKTAAHEASLAFPDELVRRYLRPAGIDELVIESIIRIAGIVGERGELLSRGIDLPEELYSELGSCEPVGLAALKENKEIFRRCAGADYEALIDFQRQAAPQLLRIFLKEDYPWGDPEGRFSSVLSLIEGAAHEFEKARFESGVVAGIARLANLFSRPNSQN